MHSAIRKFAIFTMLAGTSCGIFAAAAEGPPKPPTPRAGLFFEEAWQESGAGGETMLMQGHVSNKALELKSYGPQGEGGTQITGIPGNDTNPLHTWSGLCGAGCTFALRSKSSYADLTGTARIMVQAKTSGFHKLHPFIKLADGKTYIGDTEIGQTSDFLFEEFRTQDVKWLAFDTATGFTRGNFMADLDLSKVDEIGFTDLQPGAGHGAGGWADVGTIRVYANAVAR